VCPQHFGQPLARDWAASTRCDLPQIRHQTMPRLSCGISDVIVSCNMGFSLLDPNAPHTDAPILAGGDDASGTHAGWQISDFFDLILGPAPENAVTEDVVFDLNDDGSHDGSPCRAARATTAML
jgi:hypothetical protein